MQENGSKKYKEELRRALEEINIWDEEHLSLPCDHSLVSRFPELIQTSIEAGLDPWLTFANEIDGFCEDCTNEWTKAMESLSSD